MKQLFLLLIACTSTLLLKAQQITRYYNWRREIADKREARFSAVIKATDSGWYRRDYYTANGQLQMAGLFTDSSCKVRNGWFYSYYPDGRLQNLSRYVMGKQEGICVAYHYNGMMSDSALYSAGNIKGIRLKWHSNGMLSDSLFYREDSIVSNVGWFDNGNLSYTGYTIFGMNTGKWMYYHITGALAAEEWYSNNKLSNVKYYDETGRPEQDTTSSITNEQATEQTNTWAKFILNNTVYPQEFIITGTDAVTVVVSGVINEEGNIEDAYVSVPVHPAFDKALLDAIKKSPRWEPATSHNRRVKFPFNQSLTFVVKDQ